MMTFVSVVHLFPPSAIRFHEVCFPPAVLLLRHVYCFSAEWHVLYTSQITQKSKKYHNGIIKISSSGSHHMQVNLLRIKHHVTCFLFAIALKYNSVTSLPVPEKNLNFNTLCEFHFSTFNCLHKAKRHF